MEPGWLRPWLRHPKSALLSHGVPLVAAWEPRGCTDAF